MGTRRRGSGAAQSWVKPTEAAGAAEEAHRRGLGGRSEQASCSESDTARRGASKSKAYPPNIYALPRGAALILANRNAKRRGVEEHDGHGGSVDGEAEEDADGAKTVGNGFGIPADDNGSECLDDVRLDAAGQDPFHSEDADEYPETGGQDEGHGDDDKNLGMGICAGDKPAGEACGGDGDGGKADYDLGALVEDVQLALEKAEKKRFLAGEGFCQILGFFQGCLRDFHG